MENHKFFEDRVFEIDLADQKVLLLAEPKEEKTKSGILIPKTVDDDTPRVCKVMRVGKGDADVPMRYSVGQTVLLSNFSGKKIDFNLKGNGFMTYIVTNQIDIMFRMKEES